MSWPYGTKPAAKNRLVASIAVCDGCVIVLKASIADPGVRLRKGSSPLRTAWER